MRVCGTIQEQDTIPVRRNQNNSIIPFFFLFPFSPSFSPVLIWSRDAVSCRLPALVHAWPHCATEYFPACRIPNLLPSRPAIVPTCFPCNLGKACRLPLAAPFLLSILPSVCSVLLVLLAITGGSCQFLLVVAIPGASAAHLVFSSL